MYFTVFLNAKDILLAIHLQAKMAWKYPIKYHQIQNIWGLLPLSNKVNCKSGPLPHCDRVTGGLQTL
jgi:hypothetical protein